ncbi:diaminohydroxyphosphoribosylamino-pyrimidine deaminase [Verticillium alfalfae VaMs.102]|uniref:Diaminohydroxyphosphoribosylamino-pyrimidine deaminase n=1 Tax=Verticillium alfalfae (strain VaMs.102 / ATCC MYA-4576 / FGSC 10136) TaxID=526221 RepID=C9ST10_VERA1|nr:diaminohydroxyphosphoribosylamino-pyrimidine deaminase [Verticillium alfalfae VaMs.102]EEY21925.1 diaminohydroxyphosphoribosylamino-pyrimidine deaminase [Verticillium alfalfae VaMs.102]
MASMTDTEPAPSINPGDHKAYLQYALSLAARSPPKSTNYSVGAVLVNPNTNAIVSTGYTLELEGNTHAEQCCFMKFAAAHSVTEEELATAVQSPPLILYATMEPCSERLSGNLPCVKRILRLKHLITAVYVGVQEPEKFVSDNTGRGALQAAGIEFVHIGGLEKDILAIATAGHLIK